MWTKSRRKKKKREKLYVDGDTLVYNFIYTVKKIDYF